MSTPASPPACTVSDTTPDGPIKSSSAPVLAALWTMLGPHESVQVSTTIKSSSAAVLAALWFYAKMWNHKHHGPC